MIELSLQYCMLKFKTQIEHKPRLFQFDLSCQEPVMVETHVKEKLSGDDVTVRPMKVPVFLPEHLLAYLFGPLGMVIGDDAIRKYWDHAAQFDCPWKSISDGRHIPCGLYGDAAKYAPTGEKIIAVFLNVVLWAPKSSRMARWLLFSLENDLCLGPATLNPLMARVTESICRCYEGINVMGSTMYFAVSELRGDWEWHVSCFDLQRSWRGSLFCWRCDASKRPGDRYSFWDLSDTPDWEETQISHGQFLARMIRPETASC